LTSGLFHIVLYYWEFEQIVFNDKKNRGNNQTYMLQCGLTDLKLAMGTVCAAEQGRYIKRV
jgi:hypothetical protein